ncbi:MAG: HD domain-containing phosphohydrolase [Lachnospiraceae bacterium]|jgi:putative nucleotidyltransferase with HDIG domain|nr:HD domain-containing phosphohydrolase [Lachnospiraceae bacterium]
MREMVDFDFQEYSKLETLEDSIKSELVDVICHGIVVSNLAVLLSRQLGENDDFCNEIAIAGLLHDIGKIKMNRYLYGKDALAVEEMKYFRMHSVYSYDVLHKLNYSRFIQEAVYHHHENYDGSGYPDNLTGKDIPYGARILHVCDVFAALTSDRSYRAAFDQEGAVEVMLEETKNFDIEILVAFQRVLHSDEFQAVFDLEEIEKMSEKFMEYMCQSDLLEETLQN